ncbi:MAG: c-type cytochrome [Betaproteobacteria bacterium]|nr:c-type cytochrome [Betaproteobacteria bacterium]
MSTHAHRSTRIALALGLVAVSLASGAQMMGGPYGGPMGGAYSNGFPPGIDPRLLPDRGSQGARLFEQFCSACHLAPSPSLHTAAQWPSVVARMNARMQAMEQAGMGGMMGQFSSPTAQQSALITAYLEKYARKQASTPPQISLNSPAGRAFSAACAQCHTLPSPLQHTAAQWPAVVARMRRYEVGMGKSVTGEAAAKAIIGFLQRHAAPPSAPSR